MVGGFVRDLLLRHENLDIDIVIEGDAILFARLFAARYGARSREFQKFKTAVIIFPDGFKIDVATARTEYYEAPGALPVVEYSSIKMDLYRRDFTINTLALKLNPGEFGILLDFFGAQRDLKEGRISLLHNLSFVEDPTRVFRAVRFEQRFKFRISKLTANLINNAVRNNFFDRLSGARLFQELRLILQEENPIPAVSRLAEFDLLKPVHPRLIFDDATRAMLERVQAVLSWYDLLYLEDHYRRGGWSISWVWWNRSTPRSWQEMLKGFNLSPKLARALVQGKGQADQALISLFRLGEPSRSQIYHLLRRPGYGIPPLHDGQIPAGGLPAGHFPLFHAPQETQAGTPGPGPGGPGLPARAADQRDAGATAGGPPQREGQDPERGEGFYPAGLRAALSRQMVGSRTAATKPGFLIPAAHRQAPLTS